MLIPLMAIVCHLPAFSQQIPFQYLTVEDGLSQNTVISITQDSLGYMWFATRNGLNRYDGFDFRIFESDPDDSLTLTSNAINSLELQSGNRLWIGTSQGLCMWDQRTGRIARMNQYFYTDSLKGAYSIGDLFIDSRGDLWVMGSSAGFHIFKRKSGEQIFRKQLMLRDPPGDVEGFYGQFMEDAHGDVWIGTSRRGIWKFNRSSETFTALSIKNCPDDFAVTSMVQDSDGVVWIGTLRGLYRLNSSGTLVEPVPGLNDRIVRSLYVDATGGVWVGTDSGGLSVFNKKTGTFRVYNEKNSEGNGLLHNSVQCIYQDRQGILWVGTYAGGVNYYDPYPGVFHNYQADAGENVLNSNIITGFTEDADHNLWIATDRGGLTYFDRYNRRFEHLRHKPGQSNSISTDIIQHISVAKDGRLLIGTWQHGLDIYEPGNGRVTHNIHLPADPGSLADNSVNYIMQDSHGVVWLGTTRGVNISQKALDRYAPPSRLSFRFFNNNPNDSASLTNNYVTRIYEDRHGKIWVATWAGLNQWDPSTETFFNVNNNPKGLEIFATHKILCISEDDDNRLLLGTNENGLLVYDCMKNKVINYTKRNGLPSNTIVGLQRHGRDDWWISTSNGLVHFNAKTGSFVKYNRYDGLPSNEFRTNASARLNNGEMIFGGNNGFTIFHPDSIKNNRYPPLVSFTDFRLFNQVVEPSAFGVLKKSISVTDKVVLAAWQSSIGIDFIGINYTASPKNSYAYRLEGIDKDWNFSGSQHSANYSYLPSGSYRFYVKAANSDGVWSEPVSLSIIIKPYWWHTTWFRILATAIACASIWLLFRIRTQQLVARKRILEQTVKERTVELEGKNLMLSEAKEELQMQTEEIQKQRDNIEEQLRTIQALNEIGQKITAYLKKDELVTSIHGIINKFMDAPHLSIGYISGERNSIDFSTVRNIGSPIAEISVSLTETDRLSVTAINNNKVIVMGDVLYDVGKILDKPSPRYRMDHSYKSAVYIPLMSMSGEVTQILIVKSFQKDAFSAIHVDILKSLGGYIGIAYENAQVYKAIQAQSELLSNQTDKLKELNEIKSRFFINMSHEFRTPLTLIISPLEELLERGQAPDWSYVHHHLAIMNKNARRLLTLINGLLELRNVELKIDKPVMCKMDVVAFLKSIMMQFEYLAERHAVHYRIITSNLPIFLQIDRDMMEKVFVNLYSNAFKYTPKGGSITTTLALKTEGGSSSVEIQIADTGKGISPNDLPFIFERFYQGDEPIHTLQEGTGVGLSMVKDYVELHMGCVSVISTLNKGTVFTINLPCHYETAAFEQLIAVKDDDQQERELLPLLLLIDDYPDVLDFLALSLEGEFRVLRAENGTMGCELALQHVPDVIVCDVMMPGIDGIEVCKAIKADPRTSHIPIVLLTAKIGERSQVIALDAGADDYIAKPFKFKLLRARILNIISTRKRLHELFLSHHSFDIGEFIGNEHDKGFIERLNRILKNNIRNAALNQELLTREIGMSKTQLYRKLKALTGKTVHEYIRNYRLKVAHEIIKQSDLLMYEVAYEVGFSDAAYFSNSFKAYFGFWPKDLKKV